jgi:sugar lactone lactonase YvrE
MPPEVFIYGPSSSKRRLLVLEFYTYRKPFHGWLRSLFLLAGILCLSRAAMGQINAETGKDAPYVAWVSQYPARVDTIPRKAFFRQLTALIAGKSNKTHMVRPMSVIAAKPSDMWVLDQGNQNIFRVAHDKLEIPAATKRLVDQLPSLVGLCFAGDRHHLLFTDSRKNKVYALPEGAKRMEPFADTVTLDQPTGIAYNKVTDEVWVTETGAHRVAVFSKDGVLLRRFGTRGTEAGEFNFPTSVWIDNKGDAYIVDAMNFRVQIFDRTGRFVTMFGELGDGTGSMARPKGVATDTYGNIYVTDAQFNVVQVFSRDGTFLYRFGGLGREHGEFRLPGNIFIDEDNFIYVADSYNARVQVFQLKNGG